MTDKIQELHPDDDTQGNLHVLADAETVESSDEADDTEGHVRSR